MPQLPFETTQPQLDPSVFIAPTATVIGDVTMGPGSSLWYHSILRGDVYPIHVGARTNIQDMTVGHVTTDKYALNIGNDVTIGHRVIVHGCTIGNRCLIGMGAIVMDGVEIGDDCLIGAGAIITPNTIIPTGSLVLGAPGKVKRELNKQERASFVHSAAHYVSLAKRHQKSLAV